MGGASSMRRAEENLVVGGERVDVIRHPIPGRRECPSSLSPPEVRPRVPSAGSCTGLG
jgi:hypothetical protein